MKLMFALAAGLLFALPVVAQPLEGFLKIDGVKGEVTDPGHKKWMRITGISSLPEGCVGDEGGGHLTVRVNRKPEAKYLPSLGGWDGASARFELTDPNGEPLVMVLYDVYASNTYSGSGARTIEIGYTAVEGAPTDGSDTITLNFKQVKWERLSCSKRAVAAR